MKNRIANDLAKLALPDFETVFDVGANVGQSAERFRAAWPTATIRSFEPIKQSFSALISHHGHDPKVVCENMALGSVNSVARMTAIDTSTTNAIVGSESGTQTEEVRVVTGDEYCGTHSISHINYLKIDTEGHDLNVLIGMMGMLRNHRVDVVQVEAGMSPLNRRHANLAEFLGLLQPVGYLLFGVYDQVRERRMRSVLRRANLVFARSGLA